MPDWDDSRDSRWRDLLVGLVWLVLGLAVLGIMAAVPIYSLGQGVNSLTFQ